MEEIIVLMVDFENQLSKQCFAYEVQVVPQTITWEDLQLMLKVYSDQQSIHVHYVDEDKDKVIIESQEELNEAFKVARKSNSTLRLLVQCEGIPFHCDELDVSSPHPEMNQFLGSLTEPVISNEENPSLRLDCLPSNGCAFYLCCASSGLVLDICGGSTAPNSQLILWPRKTLVEGVQNQLWYRDGLTLRSLLNGFSIDISGERLVVSPYEPDKITQQWSLDINRALKCSYSSYWLIGVSGKNKSSVSAASLVMGYHSDQVTELKWTVEVEPRMSAESYIAMHKMEDEMRQMRPLYSVCSYQYPYPYPHPQPLVMPPIQSDSIEAGGSSGFLLSHVGVVCDNCDQGIVGTRYKCGYCNDFDLCEHCEAIPGVHDPRHILLKIRVPLPLHIPPDPSLMATHVPIPWETYNPLILGPTLQRGRGLINATAGVADSIPTQNSCPSPTRQSAAVFEGDETIPDGTLVDPGAMLLKKWRVRNAGDMPWASKTVLKHVTGAMAFKRSEVSVPYVEPGQTGVITVELIAPERSGYYESHWRLFSHDKEFGPDLWCSVNVEEAEEEAEEEFEDDEFEDDEFEDEYEAQELYEEYEAVEVKSKCNVQVKAVQVKSEAVEVQRNEAVEVRVDDVDNVDNSTPGSTSLPSTPTNTPTVMTPPLSPIAAERLHLTPLVAARPSKNIGTLPANQIEKNEIKNDSSDLKAVVNIMQELSDLQINDLDVEGSCVSDSEGDDFYIVPIPDCFNISLPVRKEASTTVVVKKKGTEKNNTNSSCTSSCVGDTEDFNFRILPAVNDSDIETCQKDSDLDSFADLDSESDNDSVISLEDLNEDSVNEERQCNTGLKSGLAATDAFADEDVHDDDDGDDDDIIATGFGEQAATVAESCANASEEPRSPESLQHVALASAPVDVDARGGGSVRNGEGGAVDEIEEGEEATEAIVSDETAAAAAVSQPKPKHDLEDLAYNMMSTAVDMASKAASVAFSTAKDVYHTLQARNAYSPPRSTWTPPDNNWTPPPSTWTPVQPTWSPPQQQWVQPDSTNSAGLNAILEATVNADQAYIPSRSGTAGTASPRDPMQQLVEMGFANRDLNARVLDAYNNDLEAAVQELLQDNDTWYNTRH